MSQLLNYLIKNQRFQDIAGMSRGVYRVINGYQGNSIKYPPQPLDPDYFENKQNEQKQQESDGNYNDESQAPKFSQQSRSEQNISQAQNIKQQENLQQMSEQQQQQLNSQKQQFLVQSSLSQSQQNNAQDDQLQQQQPQFEEQKIDHQQSENQAKNQKQNINTMRESIIPQSDSIIYTYDTEKKTSGRENKVPTSSMSRAWAFSKLGFSLLGGTISEAVYQNIGLSPKSENPQLSGFKKYLFTKSNAERFSNAFCKVRGAPLKLLQMLSIQEDELIPKELRETFERARRSADIMPQKQLSKTLNQELGDNWRELVREFDEFPLAAASIGQVHRGRAKKDDMDFAMKIQYPGVSESIDSDLNNLKRLINLANVVPKEMFLDKLIKATKDELMEECDYQLEAEKTKNYRDLFHDEKRGFYVPKVIDELSSKRVLTTEFIKGDSMDFISENYTQDERNRVGKLVMQLTLEELFKHRFMQSDPNPANFFYNRDLNSLQLIDFGAAKYYDKKFIDNYIQVVYYASIKNKQKCIELSKDLGFLTGQENQLMKEAQGQSILIVGEPFGYKGEYDFGSQTMTKRVYEQIPIVFRNRLKAPPQEVYSLHRKLSGSFLLNMKLRTKINCSEMFMELYQQYKF